MNSTTLDVYELLVAAGLDREKAKPLAKELLTRAEAHSSLATKDDLRAVVMWIASLMIGQVAIITGVMTLLFSVYL